MEPGYKGVAYGGFIETHPSLVAFAWHGHICNHFWLHFHVNNYGFSKAIDSKIAISAAILCGVTFENINVEPVCKGYGGCVETHPSRRIWSVQSHSVQTSIEIGFSTDSVIYRVCLINDPFSTSSQARIF